MTRRFLYYSKLMISLVPEEDYPVYLESLAEALPIEVVATDRRGRVIVWNDALARVAGPRDGAVGRPLLDALAWLRSDPNLAWSEVLAEVLAGGPARTFPRHPLGPRVVRATIGPMRGREGEIVGSVLSLEDITTGTREEERRRRRERVDAIHDLGASLAHEIRNPLNALSLNLQLLEECLADPDITKQDILTRTKKMIAESQRLEALVEHLLEVSRGGPLQLRPARVDDLVGAVMERLEGVAETSGCRMRFLPGSRRTLHLDAARIERATHNLVRNAIEAAVEGGGNVWVTTRDDPHSTVIVVDDDGPGIRAEDRSNVFVLYTTGKRGGTGLGLPLAREDVRRHGGEIEALPRPGGGARFVVHLPPLGPEEDRPDPSEEA